MHKNQKRLQVLIKTVFIICLLTAGYATQLFAHPHIIEAENNVEIAPEDMLADLRQAQVIFIGELHDHKGHHQAQLSIIKALADDLMPLSIGLEMFRMDSQEDLDEWVLGNASEQEFISVYRDNWSMWSVYRDIFVYARDRQIPMAGLNISREITGKVARNGFQSLSEEERQMLGNVQCVVNPTYGDYIRRAMGGHGGHGQQFLFFCEAQMLWDTMMAKNIVEYLKENPDFRMVVLTGSAHAWKFGIPRQMLEQEDISYRVILPEVFGRVDRRDVDKEILDYLWLDLGDDGWSF